MVTGPPKIGVVNNSQPIDNKTIGAMLVYFLPEEKIRKRWIILAILFSVV